MKWFESVFLPSLEEQRTKRNGKLWLTAKQVNVCTRYMNPSTKLRGCCLYEMGEKTYHIQIAPNGCALFTVFVNGWEA